MTNSQQKQQKLYQLMQENNLELSLADLIEFTYHQWEYDYLTTEKAKEHIALSRNYPLDLLAEVQLGDFLNELVLIGKALTKAHKE